MEKSLYDQLYDAIMRQDVEAATNIAKKIIEIKGDAAEALKKASEAMSRIGEMFDAGQIFLPEVVLAADAMKAAAAILTPAIPVEKRKEKLGKYVIGTVEGDVHDIGKGIVATLLEAAGFEVIDLGRDVPLTLFLEKVKTEKPVIVGLSALMTVTMVGQKIFIEMLKKEGLRDKVKVMVGGGATTGTWAEEIGADAWGEDAPSAVKKAFELIK